MRKFNIYELAGWYGTVAIISAYALVSFDAISARSFLYQILNVTGAVGIIVISAKKKVSQSVVLNIFWALIGLIAIISLTLR